MCVYMCVISVVIHSFIYLFLSLEGGSAGKPWDAQCYEPHSQQPLVTDI